MVITGKNKPTSGTKISGKYEAVIFKKFSVISIKFNWLPNRTLSRSPKGARNILLNIISIVEYLPKNIFGSIFRLGPRGRRLIPAFKFLAQA